MVAPDRGDGAGVAAGPQLLGVGVASFGTGDPGAVVGRLPAVPVPDAAGRRPEDRRGRWTDTGLVFTSPLGGLVSPRTLAAQRHVIRTAAGLGRMRSHDLRQTAVSLLLALGVPRHVVREIAGHSDDKVTMTVYARSNLVEKAAALSQLSTAVTGRLLSPLAVNEAPKDRS